MVVVGSGGNSYAKEMAIRKRIASIYNKREEDFPSLREYNDYLEEVEDMTFSLVEGIDVAAIESKIAKYQEENAEQIILARARKICLDICFEPSTTPCGHSFCKQCGKRCPKCRQLISNGRYCTVNTVLWNTIQHLFPQEIEAKKASRATNSSPECKRCHQNNLRNRSPLSPGVPLRRQLSGRRRRAAVPSQSEDAALALRLQREEFMEAFRGSNDEQPRAVAAAIPSKS